MHTNKFVLNMCKVSTKSLQMIKRNPALKMFIIIFNTCINTLYWTILYVPKDPNFMNNQRIFALIMCTSTHCVLNRTVLTADLTFSGMLLSRMLIKTSQTLTFFLLSIFIDCLNRCSSM